MTTIATGIAKKLTYKKETTWGVAAAGGAATGQALRRVTSNLDLKKATYQSKEIRADYQVADMRHGVRTVDGTISGELSAGTYADFMATACRNTWHPAIVVASVSVTLAAITPPGGVSGGAGTVTASGFLGDELKIGDVVTFTGFSASTMNDRHFWITGLTDTVITGQFLDGTLVVGSTGTVSITQAGKKTWMATSAHTNDSYTIEHWFSDIAQSEVFTGCRVNDIDIKLPASGMATVDIGFMGRDMTTGTTAYFTSPNATTTTGVLAAVNGALFLNGLQVGLVTGMNLKLSGGMSTGETVGSNVTPDVFQGAMTASGQFTAYFTDNAVRDLFINETETSLSCVFTASNAPLADFIGITLSRIKLGGASKDDGEKGIQLTVPYTALLNVTGGTGTATEFSTLTIQDSQAV
jgi:hypothetical protein